MFNKLKIIFLLLFIGFHCTNLRVFSTDSIIEIDNNFKKFKTTEKKAISSNNEQTKIKSSEREAFEASRKEIVTKIKREPSFGEVLQATLRFYAIPSTKDFASYRKQARLRNMLPEVNADVDYARDRDWGQGLDLVNPNNNAVWGGTGNLTYNHVDQNSDSFYSRGLSFGISGQWHLNDVLYDDEVTDIISEQRRFATIKNDLIEQTHSAYYERRRKQVTYAIAPPKDEIEKILFEVEIAELTAKLDSLTGGWYTRELTKRRYQFSSL